MITQQAFILRVIKFSEADLVVHALSQEGEKLKLFARSALKSRKRFGGGVLQPTHFVSISHKKIKDDGSLSTLFEASLIEGFDSLRTDYDRLQLALHFINVMDRLSVEGSTDARSLFDLLGNGLQALQVATNLDLLRTQFELKLLYYQGVLPYLSNSEELLERSIRENHKLTMEPQMLSQLRAQTEGLLAHYLG